uniref:Putative disease resistance protein RGA3 n=1 Tax=Populus alba TaxID=43335 RepID=A0A4U5PSS5_POPAL|nr:putative disease resistance protein RGA3 [Populus alba]
MEEFATDIAKSLLGKLGSSAIKELCLAWGLEAELAPLEEKLLAINAVLMDAEKKQSQNEKIRFWLQKLRGFMYDAEDALDGFECEDLRRQVVKTTGSCSRKLRRFFSSSNKLAFRFKMGHKIKDLNERLAEIESLKSLLGLTEQTGDHSSVLPEEISEMKQSFESFSGLIGRDEDKECIINVLGEPFKALILGDGLEELPTDVRYLISLRLLFLTTKQKRLLEGGVGRLGSLQILSIFDCENLEYLCEDMQGLKSLRKLCIVECKNLISLPRSMKYLTTLEYLSILLCEKLDLMTIEEEQEEGFKPLNLQTLYFITLPATRAVPKQFLQGSAGSLQTFAIGDCPNIIELPECTGNLKKLQKLEIWMCPSLSERCQRETGEDWPKIAHVPQIEVDHVNI